MKTLIIGGVAGGASCATRLRRLDEKAEIIMFERGEYVSFANCGLPYYVGGVIKEKSALTLQSPEGFKAKFNIDVRVNNEVVAINTSNKTVTVKKILTGEEYTENYDKLVISTGAEAIKPPLDGINLNKVFTLRNIPDTYKVSDFISENNPKKAVVIGGGFIGVETAENLHEKGLEVTIVEMAPQILAPIDQEMAADVQNHVRMQGVNLVLGKGVTGIYEEGSGLKVKLSEGELDADMVILAIGVKPEGTIAKMAGLEVNERGYVVTDNNMKTSDENIFACGDVVEITEFVSNTKTAIPLAGPANKQGRIVADNICGIKSEYKNTQGTSVLKVFDLTVASTGLNEKLCKRLDIKYDKTYIFSNSHAGYYPGAKQMGLKLIFDPETHKVLGFQAVGFDGVEKRVDVVATALRFGATIEDLTNLELSYAPPYSSAKDPVNMIGYVAENIVKCNVKTVNYDEIDDLVSKGNAHFIDVRSEIEFSNGYIEGFQNVPVEKVREVIETLDKSKPVYVTCQVGQRGYNMARVFTQNGFETYNLSGGYRLYSSVKKDKQGGLPSQSQLKDTAVESKENKNIKTIEVDTCGLQCPGPIMKLSDALKKAESNDEIIIKSTDPAFSSDLEGFCRRTGNVLLESTMVKGNFVAKIRKVKSTSESSSSNNQSISNNCDKKNLIVFSGDLDKAIASFIIANGAAAMGRDVEIFFTFWGLNILRKNEKVNVKKDFISKMFGAMMPRGSKKLGISKMNMGGIGAKMIREVMKNKNISSLEELMEASMENGVKIVACSMSMDVMGIKEEELIDGVQFGGVANMLAHAEESDMSLFI